MFCMPTECAIIPPASAPVPVPIPTKIVSTTLCTKPFVLSGAKRPAITEMDAYGSANVHPCNTSAASACHGWLINPYHTSRMLFPSTATVCTVLMPTFAVRLPTIRRHIGPDATHKVVCHFPIKRTKKG
eukprot:GEMP01094296.1.p2 GENE.GEMP01094296.1~~GEMP01094296.1.p2  ORF type:complete len:129 (-),score=19.65 GEMP01094296.1:69-455(-)